MLAGASSSGYAACLTALLSVAARSVINARRLTAADHELRCMPEHAALSHEVRVDCAPQWATGLPRMESRPWRATVSRVTRTTAALLALLVALPASAMLLAAGPVAGYANGFALKSLPH